MKPHVASQALSVLRTGFHDLITPPPGNVPGLDLLRTLAVSLVVSGHYYGVFTRACGYPLIIGKLPLFYFAWTGVDLFFVLSGYLIGRQLWRELMRRDAIDVPRFLLKRGLRIWPYYFAFLAWSFAWRQRTGSGWLADAFFFSNYHRGAIGGGWSLSTEEQFYIFLPLLLVLLTTVIRVRQQIVVVVGLLLTLPLIRLLILHAHPGVTDLAELQRLIYMPFHTHSDGLFAGVVIAWLSVLHPKYLAPLPPMRNLRVPAALALTGLLLRSIDRGMFNFSSVALIYSGLALYALRDQTLFARFSSLKVFYVTSRLSYGMYLNHFGIVVLCAALVGAKSTHNPYPSFLLGWALGFAFSMSVAFVTFIIIESPFLQLREHWLIRRSARTPAVRPQAAVGDSA